MLNFARLRTHIASAPPELKVVSFDIFDTLLLRIVPTERVMQLAAQKLCQALGDAAQSSKIFQSRLRFKARMDAAYAFGEAEWTVTQWIDALQEEQRIETARLHDLARQAELEAETISLQRAPHVVEALAYVKARGLRPIAVSDSWLDQDWLEALLHRFGLDFSTVYSSGTVNASKRRGTIFPVIETDLSHEPGAFLHLGDNLKADCIRPYFAGWKSLWMPQATNLIPQVMPNRLKKIFVKPDNHREIIQALTAPSKITADPYYDLAYNDLSRLLIIFSIAQWRRFATENIEVAFYIARDARLMLDVYDLIADLLPGSCPRHYIRLSRKAVALLHPREYLLSARPLSGKIGRKSIAEWVSNFSLNNQLDHQILKEAGLTGREPLNKGTRYLLSSACRKLESAIERERRNQNALLRAFFFQIPTHSSLKRMGIIDSGWACTIQDTLRHVIPEHDLISGFYIGVSHQGQRPTNVNRKYGILRDDFRRPPHQNAVEASAGVVRLWDTLLRETAGTVDRLIRCPNTGKVTPVLKTPHQLNKQERNASDTIRIGVREGTLARRSRIASLVQLSEHYSDTDIEQAATQISKNITTRPNRRLAKAILQLGFDEGTAKGQSGNIGLGGVRKGVAWYNGLLAQVGCGWLSPLLELTASIIYQHRMSKN